MDVKMLSSNEEEIEMKELDDEDEQPGDNLNLRIESTENA